MYEIFEKLRNERHLKNSDISRAIEGISNSTLSDWKRGESTPKQDKMQRIADFFGVSLTYLMTGEEQEPMAFEDKHLELIELYEKMNKEQQEAWLNMARSFVTPKK